MGAEVNRDHALIVCVELKVKVELAVSLLDLLDSGVSFKVPYELDCVLPDVDMILQDHNFLRLTCASLLHSWLSLLNPYFTLVLSRSACLRDLTPPIRLMLGESTVEPR